MRIGEKMRKWISMILCLCMLVQNAPMMVFAASTDNLCEHHPKHTEDCGYVEAVAGSACTHKHSEACYAIVECKHTCSDECGDPCTTHTCTVDNGCITMERDCHHVHGECGYAEAVEPQDCTTCQPVLVHAQNCGYVESADEVTCDCEPTVIHGGEGCTYVEGKDGSPCTHVCAVVVDSDDSCYKLLCSHKDGGHDDACGYAAAVEGHECHYECSACEDNAGDDSPVPEGICAHGNSEENCETCVGEIQVMINALPDMEDIGDHNRADVISQLEAIDDRMWKLSDAAKGMLNADKYVDAAFVLSAPEGFFGFLLTKRYEAGASAMPQASFAFLDASGVAATVITPEEQQTTSVEPVSNGGAVRGYLPVGEYTLDETVVGDWNLNMSVNGQAEGDHTFTGEGGRGYRIETVNTYRPCEHTTENAENKATCKKQAICDLCGESYGEVSTTNHDETVPSEEYDNGFCSHCGAYQSATQNAEGYYEISNAGQLYWFAEQVNSSGNYSINGKLMEDILVNENVLNSEGTFSGGAFRKWYSIGSTEFKYSGTFNGNGKTISGLYFDNDYVDGVGLFGYVDSGEIQNVGIKDSYFNGGDNVGSVVAHNHKGTVTGCYNTGTVSGANNVGGVVGKNEEGTVTDCYNSGRIGSRVNNVGGVLGGNIGTVSGCYNTGSISGQDCVGGVAGCSNGSVTDCYNTGKVDGNRRVGGVLGLNESGSTLSNCYNTGKVRGSEAIVGGVLGLNESGSTLINCYNTGEVGDGFYIGGVLGWNVRESTLINCYNTGKVSGGLYDGGVAGTNEQGTISNCYYLTGSATRGIGDGNGTTEDKTAEAFASGEVAALLGVPFGQNIDNDQENQGIPCFSDAEVYAVKNCKEETVYSNTNEKIGHKWENGVCSICEAPCSHNSFNSDTGKCSACGQACSHEGHTQDGCRKCNVANPHTYYDHVCACGLVETGWYRITLARKMSGYENFDEITVSHAVAKAETTVEVKVEIKVGFRFEEMTVTGADKSKIPATVVAKNMANTEAVVTFVMPAQDVTINFADAASSSDGVDVAVVQTGEGTVTLPEKTDRVPEDGWSFTVTPAEGYELMSLTLTSDVPVPGASELTQIPFEKQENGEYRIPREGVVGDAVRSDMILTVVFCNHSDVKITPDADGTTHTVKCNTCGKSESIAHTATTNATCTEKAVCDICHESFGEVDPDAHALTDGECTRCGAREIFFEANVSWNKVYAYYWDNINHVNPVTWPGVELTKNDGDPRYRLVVPGDTTHIIFNDGPNAQGQGNQTYDLELGVKNCYHYDGNNSYWYTYPCMEHTWGKDGKCSNCREACPHNSFNSDTGECTDCETKIAVAMVEIGGTTPTYFKTLASAVTKAETGTAEAPATLTLLKNIDLGASYQTIDSGVFTLDLNGCELAGSHSSYGVLYLNECNLTITDGSAEQDGTISSTGLSSKGVEASSNSAVTITGGTISGYDGVNAHDNSTVKISGGTITGTYCGVNAHDNSTVKISGGTIIGVNFGVGIAYGTATISGGTITSTGTNSDIYAAVVTRGSTVTITGGTITGEANDLRVMYGGSIILGLGEDDIGATFPEGLTVYDTTLDAILGERAAYWQNGKMIFLSDGQTKIPDVTVTVKAECEHGNATYPAEYITNTQHKVVCPCGYENLEDHTFNDTDGKCSKCKTDLAEASVKIGDTTYYETLDAAITAAESCVEADNAVVTLLKDIDLGESDQQIDSGVFTLDLNGCELTGSGHCVLYIIGTETHNPDVTITDSSEAGTGTISGTGDGTAGISGSDGVYADYSTVTITGGTITGKDLGVDSDDGTVIISGGTISGNYGVYTNYSTVMTINGGTITGTNSGVYAGGSSEVTITGGSITGVKYGMFISGQNVTASISGGTITSTSAENEEYGAVAAYNYSTVTITGGEISGAVNDLRVFRDGSITLTLAEGAREGATFPGGLTVSNTTLVDILANGAAYWQGTKMLTNIADDAITITGGTVTVKAPCKHENPNYSVEGVTDATKHNVVCSECDNVLSTESHTRTYTASGNVITDSCSQCKATFGTATITANGKTYNGESVTAAVQTTGALSGSSISITYSQNGEELNESAIRAGTYTASIKLGDAVAKVNFTITPATLPNAVLSATGYTYNGQQQKPAVTVTGLTENTDYTVTYPQDVTNAGEKTVTITGKGNYTGTVTKSYSIAKADSAVTKAPQAAANLVYNGKNQNLVIAGTVTGGTLQYSLDGKTWAAKIPVGKAAGTYTVSYKVVGDANHKDIAVRTLAVTIAKGTAPAVDALVQTHFYAYATANTVDLAKYLPADRGTTAYTAIGVSADIFSSVLSVTNAGVLSYTTRKLTAAPASDTQISIKVVMENYADAELTVTVKLLAVTEQTQQKIVKEELTEVPAGLAGTRFHSVDAIKTEQKRVLGLQLGYDPQGNILHNDVKLQFSPDGGKTWVDATKENFPANGLTVTLPYPSGTGKDTHNFVVSHMFTTGAKAGTIETPAVTKTADGIQFTVNGLSPVSVAWSAIPFDVNVANVTNGTVCVSSEQAAAGTQVTITATPKSGYRLSTLTVKDAAGNFCVVSTDNNGKYYFTMPAADVTVTATFTAKSTAVADTTNPKTGDDCNLVFWNSMAITSLLALAVLMLDKKKLYQK